MIFCRETPGKKPGKDFPGSENEKLNDLRGFMEAAPGFEPGNPLDFIDKIK